MSRALFETLFQYFSYAIPTLFGVMVLLRFTVFRHSKKASRVIDDPALLATAEAAANALDLRHQLAKNFIYLEDFSTLQGYTTPYMDQLIARFETEDVHATYHFVPSAPVGVVGILGESGTFQLYVERGKVAAAKSVIERHRQMI